MALAAPLVLLLVLSLLMRRAGSASTPAQQPDPAGAQLVLATLRRSASRWQLGGVLTGLLVAAAALRSDPLGRGTALAAPLFAMLTMLAVLAGELAVRTPSTGTTTTDLRVRRAVHYVPRRAGAAVGAAVVALTGLLVWTTAAGSADDMGRAGRALAHRGQRVSPWPGSFYSQPLAMVTVVGLLAAALTLRRIARRPRAGGSLALEQLDQALRQRSAERVVAAVAVLVGVPLLGVSLVAAGAVRGISTRPAWWSVLGVVLLLSAVATVPLLSWAVAVLAASAGNGSSTARRRRSRPASALPGQPRHVLTRLGRVLRLPLPARASRTVRPGRTRRSDRRTR